VKASPRNGIIARKARSSKLAIRRSDADRRAPQARRRQGPARGPGSDAPGRAPAPALCDRDNTPHSLPHGGHDGRPSRPSLNGRPTSKPPKPPRNKPDEDEDGPEPDEKARYEKFWNGKVIATHRYDPGEGKWVRTGESCPHPPESPENGGGRADGGLRFLPVDDERLAEHRGCSLREDPGAVYLVDDLEAEIADTFADRLDQGSIRGEADADAARALFNAVVDEIAIRRARQAQVPRSLRGKAHVRGELVLFDDPPLFEQRPQAQFRGLAHIDGDHLLAQVVKGVKKPAIHSCRHRSGVTTQQEVVAAIAERAHANKAFAGEALSRRRSASLCVLPGSSTASLRSASQSQKNKGEVLL